MKSMVSRARGSLLPFLESHGPFKMVIIRAIGTFQLLEALQLAEICDIKIDLVISSRYDIPEIDKLKDRFRFAYSHKNNAIVKDSLTITCSSAGEIDKNYGTTIYVSDGANVHNDTNDKTIYCPDFLVDRTSKYSGEAIGMGDGKFVRILKQIYKAPKVRDIIVSQPLYSKECVEYALDHKDYYFKPHPANYNDGLDILKDCGVRIIKGNYPAEAYIGHGTTVHSCASTTLFSCSAFGATPQVIPHGDTEISRLFNESIDCM